MKIPSYLPIHKAIGYILLSACLVSGSTSLGLAYWKHYKSKRSFDEKYNIVAIIQSCENLNPLPLDYISEMLGLSIDRPCNLYKFNAKEAVERLRMCPMIKNPEIQKIFPGMLYVKYSVRKPIATLPEFTNSGISEEGSLIPMAPFFGLNKIPRMIFGSSSEAIKEMKISNDKLELAKDVFKVATAHLNEGGEITCIDVSGAFLQDYGKREIILLAEELVNNKKISIALRFSPDNWEDQLANYHKLRIEIKKEAEKHDSLLIDMRISQLAFISECV